MWHESRQSRSTSRRRRAVPVVGLVAAAVFVGVGRADSAPTPNVAPNATPPNITLAKGAEAATDPRSRAGGVAPQSSSSGGRAGDFSGDGKRDLFSRNATSKAMFVYPGSGALNGLSTFGAGVQITGSWSAYRWVGQGDFNGDRFADAVGVTPAGVLHIALNRGQGLNGLNTLNPIVQAGSGWQINDVITTSDINGDGKDDMVAKRSGTGDLYVYLNSGTINGDATFGAPIHFVQGLNSAVDMQWVDVTGDDAPDLLFQWSSNGYQYLWDRFADQDSSGRFIAKMYALSSGWGATNATVLVDVNSDKRPDLVYRGTSSGALVAVPHSGRWNFANPPTVFNFGAFQQIGQNWNVNDIVT